MTGQERFAYEIVSFLDDLVKDDDLSWELVVPMNATNIPVLNNIKIIKYGKAKGFLWEQIWLTLYLFKHKGICLNLCTIMPILYPGIICIHDLGYKVCACYFTSPYSLMSKIWHRIQYNLACHFSPKILTVSEYSKKQLVDIYHVEPSRILVVGNGWEHFERVSYDDTIFIRCKYLFNKEYFFSLANLAPNKNIKWIIDVANKYPNYNFLIAGKAMFSEYNTNLPKKMKNVFFLGYITDSEIKSLMKKCKAFMFPSFFEGFGIPPLEALSVGAKCIVAKTSCLPEIFGDAVYWIDPNNPNVDIDQLLLTPVSSAEDILKKYKFKRFAFIIYNEILKNSQK